MGKRAERSDQEVSERRELRCMWAGLFSILGSRQIRVGPYKLFTNRRPGKPNIVGKHLPLLSDNSRKLDDQLPSFHEECREIQNEANLANTRATSVRSLIQDDIYNDRHKNEAMKNNIERANQSFNTSVVSSSHHQRSSSTSPHIDDRTVEEAKMSIRAFIDQMFVDGKIVRRKESSGTESMLLSDALDVFSTSKRDLFMDLMQEPKQSHRKSSGNAATFSVREIKQKLRHTFGDFRKEPSRFSAKRRSNVGEYDRNAKSKGKKLKSDRGSDIARLNVTTRMKLDSSSSKFSKKHDFNVALEVKRRRMFARLGAETSVRSPETLRTILPSTGQELSLRSPRRDGQCCSCSARIKFSRYGNFPSPNERRRSSTEVISCDDYEEYDYTTDCLSTETTHETHDIDISETRNMSSNGEPYIVENNIFRSDGTVTQSTPDCVSENETFTSTVDDPSSTPTYVHNLNMSESPVSVLEQHFTKDANNDPSNVALQTDGKRSQPRCLYFENYSIEDTCNDEQDHIAKYVCYMLQASNLNWEQLSKIDPRSEELIDSCLFDEVEFLNSDYHFDVKVLFDHLNEVVLEMHRSGINGFPRQATSNPKNSRLRLEEVVLDEMMRKGAEFYLLESIEERTVDQIVAKDVSDSGSWIDDRTEAERVIIHISEDILEEFVLDIVLDFHK